MFDILMKRILPDGRLLHVLPLLYGRARICVGPANTESYDDGW